MGELYIDVEWKRVAAGVRVVNASVFPAPPTVARPGPVGPEAGR
ncbi:hypothetical protein [Streptomyces sp. NPDC086787]